MEDFAVVAFKYSDSGDEVELVPTCWLQDEETKCSWPNFKNKLKVTKAVKEMTKPGDAWSIHSIKVLAKCRDYNAGRLLARNANNASGIQREGNYGLGRRRIKSTHNDSEDDSDSSIPQQPKPKKRYLPEPPEIEGEEETRCPGSSRKYSAMYSLLTSPSSSSSSSTQMPKAVLRSCLEDALRPVMLAVARCESRLQEQQKTLEMVLSIVKNLKESQTAPPTGPDVSLLDGLLPIKSYVDFEDFEQQINGDCALRKSLACRLQVLGGATVKAAVKNMVDLCMTSGLQYEFNWEGRLGWKTKTNTCKKGFKNTTLCKIMINILVNKTQLATDESEVGKTIMVYLRNAGDRYFGRKRPNDSLS
ncbi:uncharacterized protein LOC135209463 [Macrobrachium nipponense]|uniref:uncharacterized protein LOC135209463 n=1 Tax=Macrobrachium nipponense TaxID=159736 RepID=UPI0030C86307